MESKKIGREIKTIISDDDPSFMKGLNDFNINNHKKIYNIICYWHKYKNHKKKLNEIHLPSETNETIKALFNRIARCPKKEVVLLKSQISKIINLSHNYFKTEISDYNDLCSILMNSKDKVGLISGNSPNQTNPDSQANQTNNTKELEKKMEHYKSLYNSHIFS